MEDGWDMETDTIKLSDLKAGDDVARTWDHWSDPQIVTIDRVTQTQIVVGGEKYNRDSGWRMGSSRYSRGCISVVTDGIREQIEKSTLVERARHKTPWERLSLEALRQIKVILDANPV